MNSIFSESTESLGKKVWPLLARKTLAESPEEKRKRIATEIRKEG
jgi:hypothetical protein